MWPFRRKAREVTVKDLGDLAVERAYRILEIQSEMVEELHEEWRRKRDRFGFEQQMKAERRRRDQFRAEVGELERRVEAERAEVDQLKAERDRLKRRAAELEELLGREAKRSGLDGPG